MLVRVARARVDVAVALGLGVREGLLWRDGVKVARVVCGAETVAVAEMITSNANIAHALICAITRVENSSGVNDFGSLNAHLVGF